MNILNTLTKNYLKLNKKRTIVTIIGIILSGAMITAVTTLAVSFQSFLLQAEIQQDGAWEAVIKKVPTEKITEVVQDKSFDKTMKMVPVGMVENPYSEDRFLYLKEYDKIAIENMKIRLIEGRLPENDKELLLSKSFFDGKENEPKIGDTITLTIGKRMADGKERIAEPYEDGETFLETGSKTYTICGKIEKPDFENSSTYYTAGVSLLDETKPITANTIEIGVISKKVTHLYEDTERVAKKIGLIAQDAKIENEVNYNTYVLAYKGVNGNSGFNKMLYSVCGILILVIAIGSILVIYNSFAISVSERKKQFGMLASIGATAKQIQRSVVYEGAMLGIIAIPIGILSGVVGIGITLKIVNNLLQPMFTQQMGSWKLELVISWPALVIAAVLIAITIYLSVRIPAKRASKITPIEAIRQSEDIKVKAKKLKTSKIIRKLFGIEGEMALKNLKRSRKRYRTTVLSLIISIVLFISVSGFVGYMYNGFDTMYESVDYDYGVRIYHSTNPIKEELEKISGVKRIAIIDQAYLDICVPAEKIQDKMKDIIGQSQQEQEAGEYTLPFYVMTLNEKELQQYLKQVGISKLADNQIILINYIDLLRTEKMEGKVTNYQEKEIVQVENTKKKQIEYEIAKVTEQMPFGIENKNYPKVIAITTQKGYEQVLGEEKENAYTKAVITAENSKEVKEELERIQKQYSNTDLQIENMKEEMQLQRNLKTIIQIFLYGFIILISAIGIANIFNTISTNINLRRREFAMLKSIGMTDTSFKKMLNLECVFYGTKALLYGLPIGIGICYLLNQGFGNLIDFTFHLPWNSIFIAIIAVYLVVYVTMIYSSKKVKKENIIDVLRDENI